MTIKPFRSIISKDLKIFFRNTPSAITILIAPLLIILLAGLSFNSSALTGVTISTHADSYTNLTEEILADFTSQGYFIDKSASQEDCVDAVKLTNSQICIIFPSDLSTQGSEAEVIFHIDYSRINLAYTLIHEVENKISIQAKDLGTLLAQDLINSLNQIKETLPENKEQIDSSLNDLSSNKDNLDEISFSTQDIDKAITLLKAAKSKVNDSTAISKIDESITLLNSVKEESDLASDNLADVSSTNSQATKDLKQISNDLEELITNLNTQKISEADSIVSPIKIKIESIKLDSTNRDYLIPTILALIALFGAILLASTFVLKEKKTKAYFRNFMTPTKDLTFIMATYVTCLIILTIQFLLVFVGIKYILQMNLIFLPLEIISILFLTLTTFIFIGMFIGYIFKSEETTIFAAVLTSAILMFFSNVIIPIENIAGSLRKIVEFNPVVLSDIALKKVLLFNFTFDSLKIEIIGLASIFIFFLILTYFARKITKRKL